MFLGQSEFKGGDIMAEEWQQKDNLRTMISKYNAAIQELEELKTSSTQVNQATEAKFTQMEQYVTEQIQQINEELDQKVSDVTAEDLGLGNVDNTADIDKPVSTAQQQAIKLAVKDTLTSQPATTIEGDPANGSIIVFGDLIVQGSDNVKKQLIFNTNGTCSWVRVN